VCTVLVIGVGCWAADGRPSVLKTQSKIRSVNQYSGLGYVMIDRRFFLFFCSSESLSLPRFIYTRLALARKK